MYRRSNKLDGIKSAECSQCQSKTLLYQGGKLTCRNCGELVASGRFNKYGAKRTEFNGKTYDSKFEASVAQELEFRKKAGDIKDYDTQYKVSMTAYRKNGEDGFTVNHKVDFRVHENDGSFTLIEAKGVETSDYKWRRKFLENIWLPEHPDHVYQVVKQNQRRK